MSNRKPPAWAIRKVSYALVAVIVGILGAFGILSEVQADQWSTSLDQIIPWALGVITPAIAASKTHPGSDSTATAADVAAAASQGVDAQDVATRVVDQINSAAEYGQHAAAQAQQAIGSIADYYRR